MSSCTLPVQPGIVHTWQLESQTVQAGMDLHGSICLSQRKHSLLVQC
jgi:hypothetical protein